MTVVVPPPVALRPPPGDPAALDDVAGQLAGAASSLESLSAVLLGGRGSVPDWVGADAAAAAVAVSRVAALADDAATAVRTAGRRVSDHGDLVREVRARISALAAEQEEDHARAWGGIAALPDPVGAALTGAPEAVAVLQHLESGEARRVREHARLLAEVADDAAATAGLLAGCSAVVGGTGQRGDADRAVVHLALLLPGWGEAELTARGAALAGELGGLSTLAEREALARRHAAYAGIPAFAGALLSGIGRQGVRGLLTDLGGGGLRGDSALAAMVAAAFGAVDRSRGSAAPGVDLLDAVYVDPDRRDSHEDVVALGMAAVVAAGLRSGSAGPRPTTVLAWARQLLAREQAMAGGLHGGRAVDRAGVLTGPGRTGDPLAVVADSLARAEDPRHAAALLAEAGAWDRLLARPWDDEGASLARLVARCADASGPDGDAAVRAGLEALGRGLEDNDPDGWAVERDTAAAISPALGAALAGHVTVAVDALTAGVDGPADPVRTDALRGLGLLTSDPRANAVLAEALLDWVGAELAAGAVLHTPGPPAPVVAVPASYLAAQQWAAEMDHALDGFEAQAAAERRAFGWTLLTGWTGYLPGVTGDVAGVIQGYAAILLDMDGTWEAPPALALVAGSPSAEVARGAELSTAEAAEVTRQARSAFDRTAALLGTPTAPESPPTDWLGPLQDAAPSQVGDLVRAGRRGVAPGNGG